MTLNTGTIRWWAGIALLALAETLCAQETPEPPGNIPTLPETTVVGEAPPLTPPEAVFNNAPPSDLESSLPPPAFTQSTIFGTPSVRGYQAPESTTGSLIRVKDLDLPNSVGVVTRDIVRDQQALRMEDVLRDVSGAAKLGDQLRPDSFTLRGLEVRSRDYRKNGFMDPTYTPRDFANVERVEVLKGPASMLFGTGQPSGVTNLITKKPLPDPYNRETMQAGSFGFQRYTIDTSGPIDEDKTALYRLNFAYEHKDGFRDFAYNERAFVAPSLTWQLDDESALTWEGEYLEDRRRFDTGVAALNGKVGQMPITTFLGEPNNDFQLFQDWRQSVFFDRKINDIWSTRVGATMLLYNAPSSGTFPTAQEAGTTILDRSRQNIPSFFEQYYSLIANLSGVFETGPLKHRTVFGTEQGWFVSNHFQTQSTVPGLQNLPIDALDPMYSGKPVLFLPAVFDATYRLNRHGVYAQDLIDFTDQWKAMVGVRYDHADVTYERDLLTFGIPTIRPTNTTQGFDYLTPRVGLIYQEIPDVLSYYAAYMRSFDAPYGGARIGTDPLKPELGQSWELGMKYQFNPKVTAQAAVYWLRKDNYTIDTVTSTPPFFVTSQVGHLTSQGIELSMVGQITERWSTNSNYTLTDAVLRDPTMPNIDDRRPRNVPRHMINLWTRYNVVQTSEQTLGGGLGMMYMDNRLASFGGQVRLPDFTRFDAGLFYTRKKWDFSLYLENLFDRQYYASSVGDLQITPGTPFNVRAQLGVMF